MSIEQRRRAVCPGSYDPVTLGHVDIIERTAQLYDEVVVAVLVNPEKSGYFEVGERLDLLRASIAGTNITVDAFRGQLLVQVARSVGAGVVVKGIRSAADAAYELPMAALNRHQSGVETLLLPSRPDLSHISSTMVRQIAQYGGDVDGLVPAPVADAISRRRSLPA